AGVWVADPDRNVEEVVRVLEDARGKGAQLLVLPELGLSGYTCGDLFFSLSTLVAGAERALSRLLAATSSHRTVVVVGLPVVQEGKLFNAAAVVQAGPLGGVVAQTYPPGLKGYHHARRVA